MVAGLGKLWESDGKQPYVLVGCVIAQGISCIYVRAMGVMWSTGAVKLVTTEVALCMLA